MQCRDIMTCGSTGGGTKAREPRACNTRAAPSHILSSFPPPPLYSLLSSHLLIPSYLIYSVQAERFAAIPLPLARFSLRLLSSFKLTSLASKYFYFWSRTLSRLILFPSSSLIFPSPISSSHLILSCLYLILSYIIPNSRMLWVTISLCRG